jgi:hypothetical protein
VSGEDVSDCLFVNVRLSLYVKKISEDAERFLFNIFDEPGCQCVMLIDADQRLLESFSFMTVGVITALALKSIV